MSTAAPNSNPPPDKAARRTFEALVNEHHSRIRRYIRTMGVPGSSVDDIAHEALIVAYHRFADFEEGTSFTAWICAIARNLIRGERRKESRRFNILKGAFAQQMEAEAQPDELVDSDEGYFKRVALKECLEQVPEDGRKMIHARYQEGLDFATIAESHEVSSGTIRMRMTRLRKALHNCITDKLADWTQ